MIGSVTGTVIYQSDKYIVLETASGVGYRVMVGSQVFALDDQIKLFTYHHIREDASDLYGFTEPEQLKFFELLLTVSGVGPKVAQTILLTVGRHGVSEAVSTNQPALLKAVPGVGQKVAEKIIVELRNKISSLPSSLPATANQQDIIEALTNFGYHQSEILEALKTLDQQASTEEKVRQALRLLSKR